MENRFSKIGKFWYVIFIIFSALGIILAINQLFSLALFGFSPLDTSYLYLSLTFYLSTAFIIYPAAKSAADKVPWYDVVLFLAAAIISIYFGIHGKDIIERGWEYRAPWLRLFSAFSFGYWSWKRFGDQPIYTWCLCV